MNLYHCTANGVFGSFGDYVCMGHECRRGSSQILARFSDLAAFGRPRKEGSLMDTQEVCRLIGYGIEYIKAVAPAAVLAWIAWRVGT